MPTSVVVAELPKNEVANKPEPAGARISCPACGNDGTSAPMTITETFTAYHPATVKNGRLVLRHALRTMCSSEWFDDGASDYAVHCWRCALSGALSEFGVPEPDDWEWR